MDQLVGKSSPKIVGYWLNERKCQKFRISELDAACRRRGIKLVKIDLSRPIEEQGPFDLILHKLTSLYAQALNDDPKALTTIKLFEEYVKDHPETYVIDPLPGVQKLLLRNETYDLVYECTKGDDKVFTPTYTALFTSDVDENRKRLNEANVTFPVVCKPLNGGGGKEAHELAVVFNEKAISECVPCVAQSFINHGAVLYKLFVMGPVWFDVVRPSLKNFYAGAQQETVHFNSHHVSKPDSQSPLNELDPKDKNEDLPTPDRNIFKRIVGIVQEALNMDLIGIDVVIESSTGKYGIIDVNAFPSYDSVPNVMEHLVDLMNLRMNRSADSCIYLNSNLAVYLTAKNQYQEDSGVDTG